MGETDRTVKRDPSDGALAAGALLLAAGVTLSFGRLHADDNDASLYALIGQRLAADGTPEALPPAPPPHAADLGETPILFWRPFG